MRLVCPLACMVQALFGETRRTESGCKGPIQLFLLWGIYPRSGHNVSLRSTR